MRSAVPRPSRCTHSSTRRSRPPATAPLANSSPGSQREGWCRSGRKRTPRRAEYRRARRPRDVTTEFGKLGDVAASSVRVRAGGAGWSRPAVSRRARARRATTSRADFIGATCRVASLIRTPARHRRCTRDVTTRLVEVRKRAACRVDPAAVRGSRASQTSSARARFRAVDKGVLICRGSAWHSSEARWPKATSARELLARRGDRPPAPSLRPLARLARHPARQASRSRVGEQKADPVDRRRHEKGEGFYRLCRRASSGTADHPARELGDLMIEPRSCGCEQGSSGCKAILTRRRGPNSTRFNAQT